MRRKLARPDNVACIDHYHGIPALKAWNALLVGHLSPIGQRAATAMASGR